MKRFILLALLLAFPLVANAQTKVTSHYSEAGIMQMALFDEGGVKGLNLFNILTAAAIPAVNPCGVSSSGDPLGCTTEAVLNQILYEDGGNRGLSVHISGAGVLPGGTVDNSTAHWDDTAGAWEENISFLANTTGDLTLAHTTGNFITSDTTPGNAAISFDASADYGINNTLFQWRDNTAVTPAVIMSLDADGDLTIDELLFGNGNGVLGASATLVTFTLLGDPTGTNQAFDFQDGGGTLLEINGNGSLDVFGALDINPNTAGSITLISSQNTWNSGATTYTGFLMNITDTASAAGSLLMDLQVGASTIFSINKNGDTNFQSVNDAATPTINFGDGDTGAWESADDILELTALAGTTGVQINGVTGVVRVGSSANGMTLDNSGNWTFLADLTATIIGGESASFGTQTLFEFQHDSEDWSSPDRLFVIRDTGGEEFVVDGDGGVVTGGDNLVVNGATTSGFRFDIVADVVELREGDDSAFEDLKLKDLEVTGTCTGCGGGGTTVEDHAVSDTLTAAETGTTHTNNGAAGQVILTLPTAAADIQFTIYVADAQELQITAGAGDTIRVAGSVTAGAGNIDSNTVGSSVTLLAINADEWVATSNVGSWNVPGSI